MTALSDVLDVQQLQLMIDGGYVRTQVHPVLRYTIYNYTEKAAYESVWNDVTLTCRGLIVDDSTGAVLARPWPKFFNYGQTGAPALPLDAPAVVTDKADGSLGILYHAVDGHAVATRGSFASEQAIHATYVWRARYAGTFEPRPGWTYLFEIIYPSNRIVVDYGDFDDLILLGAVEIATGRTVSGAFDGWPGPVIETFEHATLAAALAAPDRPGREGFVVHVPDQDLRVKIKQEDYVLLHRIVTGLNARSVWEPLADGRGLDELIEALPDEFHDWVREVAATLTETVDLAAAAAEKAYAELVAGLPDGWTRKDFALAAVPNPLKWALFLLLDGRDIRPALWRNAKPEAAWTHTGRVYTEDTA